MQLELNPGVRKFNQVDTDSADTRRVWFNPKLAEPLDLKLFVIIGVIALGAVFVVGAFGVVFMLAAGAFIFYSYQNWQKANGPIDAYRFSRMVRERTAAIDAFEGGDQCRIDNDVSKEDWDEAEASKRVVRLTEVSNDGLYGDVLGIAIHEGEWIAREIRQTTAIALRRGLVLHSTIFDAVLAMNKAPAYETIPWAAISRVRRQSGSILVETMGGSQLTLSISTADQERDESLEELNSPEYVNEFVIPFVRAAQRFLREAHGSV